MPPVARRGAWICESPVWPPAQPPAHARRAMPPMSRRAEETSPSKPVRAEHAAGPDKKRGGDDGEQADLQTPAEKEAAKTRRESRGRQPAGFAWKLACAASSS